MKSCESQFFLVRILKVSFRMGVVFLAQILAVWLLSCGTQLILMQKHSAVGFLWSMFKLTL